MNNASSTNNNERPRERWLLSVLLSALSYLGGHFYNRRWDRALLFFALLMFWGIGVYVSLMFRISGAVSDKSGGAMLQLMSRYWSGAQAGWFVLWVASVAVTYFDARRSKRVFVDRWTFSGLVGAFGFSVLLGVFLAAQAISFFAFNRFESMRGEVPTSSLRYQRSDFLHNVFLGRPGGKQNLPKPPDGDGYLTGRFVFENKPAAGVGFSLVLNGTYKTEKLTTDKNGEFQLRLPRGEWYVVQLDTQDWSARPKDGELMIVTGEEPKLVGDRYDEQVWFERRGIKVTVGDRSAQPQLMFNIRRPVALRWPEAGGKRVATTVDKGIVAWTPYPNAERYLLRISEGTREGGGTSYREVAAKQIVGATDFRLANLQTVPSDGSVTEYVVKVFAFDKDKNFLSKSEEGFDSYSFVLSDNKQFVRTDERIVGSERFSAKEMEQAHNNNRRLDAAVVLLNDGMDKEAERLLNKIQGKVDEGKKLAVNGYAMAKRGRCAEAERLFARATSEAGDGCVPDYYRAACGARAK